MTERTLTVYGVPVAKARPKFRRTGQYVTAYTPYKTKAAERAILAAWRETHKNAPPMSGAIEMAVVAYMPLPKGTSKKKVLSVAASGAWHISRPDEDNLQKLVQDALNGAAYTDDSIICALVPVKVYAATTPGLYIRLRQLDETPSDYLTARGLPAQLNKEDQRA